MDQPDPIVETAERQLRQGEPLTAYNTLQPALERWPAHLRLRQLQGLALARGGDVARANAILAALAAEGHEDGETLGLLGRMPGSPTRMPDPRRAIRRILRKRAAGARAVG